MINILSIRCGLAFGPYLEESAGEFLDQGFAASRVVRQGGSGLIVRSDDLLRLRFQNREAGLDRETARHYRATIDFRRDAFDLQRMSDEIVLASVGDHLLLSHPQSEIWLEVDVVSSLLEYGRGVGTGGEAETEMLPDWLKVSAGAGRLLLSDQRSGRWVLLGSDHVAEMERRHESIQEAEPEQRRLPPPVILMKGLKVHLQSAFRLASVLERFAEAGELEPYEERFFDVSLSVAKAAEGLEVSDDNLRVAMNTKEARKWALIIRGELERLRASQMDRSSIRTVLIDGDEGRWILQWGDEVFLGSALVGELKRDGARGIHTERIVTKREGDLFLILDRGTGDCVALNEAELDAL